MANSTNQNRKHAESMGKDVPNIFTAAMNNDVASLEIALAHYSVNERDAIGMTPLHYAASTLSFDTVDRLLKQPGIDATLADKFARSAATVAFQNFGDLADKMIEKLDHHCYPWLYETPDDTVTPK